MSFLGWILIFICIFYWVGGSSGLVAHTPNLFRSLYFHFFNSWDVLPWTDFLRFYFFGFHWVGGSLRPASYTPKFVWLT